VAALVFPVISAPCTGRHGGLPLRQAAEKTFKLYCSGYKQLFSEILSNAGEYRKATGPNKGEVFFGPATNQFAGAAVFS